MNPERLPPPAAAPYSPLDLARGRSYPLRERRNLVDVKAFGRPIEPGASAGDFLRSLPDFLGALSVLVGKRMLDLA